MIAVLTCAIIYYMKDLSVALGKSDRISPEISVWIPIIIIGLINSIGLLQINENKSILIKILITFLFTANLYANNLEISSTEIKLDKKESKIVLKGNIEAKDDNQNVLKTEEAFYLKKDLLNSIGATTIVTSEDYLFESKNVVFDNKNKIIKSDFPTKNY